MPLLTYDQIIFSEPAFSVYTPIRIKHLNNMYFYPSPSWDPVRLLAFVMKKIEKK